jgi:phage recombination protein Bet
VAENALAVLEVTPEQLALVKNTVAFGATAEELQLYLYDCKRQGVHPLDKMIYFTKRGKTGKYTPVTSIDFMRTRAADSGEYAGSDDPVFVGEPAGAGFQATATVWRMVQGTRCPFVATARWSEYKPDKGQSGVADAMWLRMPHSQLGKCAEALALRKAFPKQTAKMYEFAEMDQAGEPQNGCWPRLAPRKSPLYRSPPLLTRRLSRR